MQSPQPAIKASLFHPGQQIAVAVSGGADSVALLRRLLEERPKLGIVLSVAHLHHGIRGEEADADAAFVTALAAAHDLPLYLEHTDAPAAAALRRETLEEAARNLRYAFFEELMAKGAVTAVATAHTLDDQAETVLYKLLRGAWTEGLSGIHPVLATAQGNILRPFLETARAEIESWLRGLAQPWREDASNRDPAHTRNRIRHELLPLLVHYNPEIARQLSRLAAISASEERYWQDELGRLLPSLLLPGKAVRGGGRSSSTHPGEAALAIELARLRQLHPAVARRVLRAAALELGVRLGFDHTERLMALSGAGGRSRGSKVELPGGIVAQRTPRELRLTRTQANSSPPHRTAEYPFLIPGEVRAPEYDLLLRGSLATDGANCSATLRNWRAGDKVTLPHSQGPKKVADLLDRLHISGSERATWPVVEIQGESGSETKDKFAGRIVWMRGVEVDAPEFVFTTSSLAGNRSNRYPVRP